MSNKTIIFSSNNSGKIREVKSIFESSQFKILPQSELGLNEGAEETACTFVENALLKARFIAHKVNEPVMAEDSGLVISLLNNEPGVISARYAGEKATNNENI
ncbi:MAG: non-canonical purine NTP pyrophosphatase, partial [Legionellales bacterium]|nr:non-canonical purine NTP pyrophosphatase [Legionellales bacterium]